MEKAFEVVVQTTPASCKAIAFVRAKQHGRTIWLINILIAIGAAILWTVGSAHAYWITALLILLVIQSLFHIPLTGILRYYVYRAEDKTVRVVFDADEMRVYTHAEESRILYSEITEWAETPRFYVVMMHNHTPIALEKKKISHDKRMRMKAVLGEKTGKVCRQVRI